MGRSITINCLGYAPTENPNKERLFCAMNRREIQQQRHKARKEGLSIKYWIAQTHTGVKILKGIDIYHEVPDNNVPAIKMITCSICNGEGHNGKYHCPVCDGSGITTSGYEKRWEPWQLENMKERNNKERSA